MPEEPCPLNPSTTPDQKAATPQHSQHNASEIKVPDNEAHKIINLPQSSKKARTTTANQMIDLKLHRCFPDHKRYWWFLRAVNLMSRTYKNKKKNI